MAIIAATALRYLAFMPAHRTDEFSYPRQRWRLWRYGAIFSSLPFEATEIRDHLQRSISDIGQNVDEKRTRLTALRAARMDTCSMTTVAGAIIVQVAITALSLTKIEELNWTVRAFFASSLATGCLSVYYSCILHRELGYCLEPAQFESWLSKTVARDTETSQEGDPPRRVVSMFAAMALCIPSALLDFSVGSLIIGLGEYLGLMWLGVREDAMLNIFICFLVADVGGGLVWIVPLFMRDLED